MTITEQFQQHVVTHMQNLSAESRAAWAAFSEEGECVSISCEVYRGCLGRKCNDDFVAMATAHNGIRPDEYFIPWLAGPHEVIGTVTCDDTSPAPVYFFQHNGVYAMVISETQVMDMWLSWPRYPADW
ncbi:hypothetical protein I7V28_19625 [Lelliottia amnigena]|uniref:hypothetical protein n=1 Tax=Lelliottia TaxID=1330545 RepID=UPI00192C0248|nr:MULTISPECIES: hypothetical protein [Lelliottia]MBL5885713.1 hypothetical protein [Lelliottia aquatilis]MBL5923292.1 hypothetical protein [Lelliottia amnigena]MBL5932201.1 hypothetical protein [Lelliottia amnigena]